MDEIKSLSFHIMFYCLFCGVAKYIEGETEPARTKPGALSSFRLFLCERSMLFLFCDFEQLHEHTYMRQNRRLCKYSHKHSDLGLKSE